MRKEQVQGYVLITLSIVLALAAVGQSMYSGNSIVDGMRAIFNGTTSSYGAGKTLGMLLYCASRFCLAYLLWLYGQKCLQNEVDPWKPLG